jgi:hypothetical protein
MISLGRRQWIAGSLACTLGCSSSPAPTRGTASREPGPPKAPFRVVDLMPAFWAFWEKAKASSIEAQRAAFIAEVAERHPDVYAPNVLRLDAEDPGALAKRLDQWLPKLPAIEADMRRLHKSFVEQLGQGTAAFMRALPDFSWAGNVYLFASIDSFNGGGRKVGNDPALLFGLDVIARSQPTANLTVLVHHELYHFYQASGGDVVAHSLWVEGLATHASMVLNPRATEDDALPISHLHDSKDPQLDAPERRISLAKEMPARVAALGSPLLAALDSKDPGVYSDFFLGRASERAHGEPVRSGYWFGLQLVRRLARGRSLQALARIEPASIVDELRAELTAMVASFPPKG